MFGKIDKTELYKKGISAGIAEMIYIILVVGVISSIDKFMAQKSGGPLSMMAVLLLFVTSAGISAFLVFGYPAYFALQKKYHEAIFTLIISFLTLAVCFILVLLVTSLL